MGKEGDPCKTVTAGYWCCILKPQWSEEGIHMKRVVVATKDLLYSGCSIQYVNITRMVARFLIIREGSYIYGKGEN